VSRIEASIVDLEEIWLDSEEIAVYHHILFWNIQNSCKCPY